MQGNVRKILKYLLSLSLAVVLLFFSFRGIEWDDFFMVLKECRLVWVSVSIAAGLAAYLFRSLRWRLLLRPAGPAVKRTTCFNAFSIGKICDMAVPHIGEFVRCGVVSKRSGVDYDKTLGTVVLERSWDILTLFLLLFVLLLAKWSQFGAFFTEKIWMPVTGRMNIWIVVLIVAVLAAALLFVLMNPRVRRFASGIWEGVKSFVNMEGKWLFLLYTVLLWAMFLVMSLTIILALPIDYDLGAADALFIMLVGSIAGLVPVPGGFGAFHYLVATSLTTLYGIPFEMGLVFATLSHESQAVMTMVTGAVSYISEFVISK